MRRVLLVACIAVWPVGLWVNVVAAAPRQAPTPKVSVGISIDAKVGRTETAINCVGDGKHQTVNGDGTLFMENRTPHTMLCFITIRRVGDPA
jgi:hypothetical protein